MVPNLLFYQLPLIALVLICLIIHVGWPDHPTPPPRTPLKPSKPRRKRSKKPKAFTGYIPVLGFPRLLGRGQGRGRKKRKLPSPGVDTLSSCGQPDRTICQHRRRSVRRTGPRSWHGNCSYLRCRKGILGSYRSHADDQLQFCNKADDMVLFERSGLSETGSVKGDHESWRVKPHFCQPLW